jgi:hypothetical protein
VNHSNRQQKLAEKESSDNISRRFILQPLLEHEVGFSLAICDAGASGLDRLGTKEQLPCPRPFRGFPGVLKITGSIMVGILVKNQ